MKWKPLIDEVELSPKSVPGRAGFIYALEFNHKEYRYTDRQVESSWKRWQKNRDFWYLLTDKFGKEYQTHWQRPQKNRRWYRQILGHGKITRYCFRTENDRFLARMLIK